MASDVIELRAYRRERLWRDRARFGARLAAGCAALASYIIILHATGVLT